jgi:D-glycero-D-manno-heptose 1,7-bisphosphate phosphatase
MRPAIFFDRDGVLNYVVERNGKPASPRCADELHIVEAAAQVVADCKAAGYLIFVVTNQPDVRRDLMSADTLTAIHAKLRAALQVDDLMVCVHDDRDACACRKPKPGMLQDLARRWDVDLSKSWMIGDQDRDVECGNAAGCATVLIARPYNSGLHSTTADRVANDLAHAGRLILNPAAPARAVLERSDHVR